MWTQLADERDLIKRLQSFRERTTTAAPRLTHMHTHSLERQACIHKLINWTHKQIHSFRTTTGPTSLVKEMLEVTGAAEVLAN